MRFLGIDLGWKSGASGLCCLEWQEGELVLLSLEREVEIVDVLSWVKQWTDIQRTDLLIPGLAPVDALTIQRTNIQIPALVAVDAPTLIPNQTGTRLPDRLTHKYFGKYHAGCYPANLQRPFAQRTVDFGLSLEELGFCHAPIMEAQKYNRYQIEVFPHPAQVNLFNLDRILKYKKGKLGDRYLELTKLRDYILTILPNLEPKLQLINLPEIPNQGKAMKKVEDMLDSLICAYVGAYWWYWGEEKNLVLGNVETGYIIVPQRIIGGLGFDYAQPPIDNG